jgi:hypothetical protein
MWHERYRCDTLERPRCLELDARILSLMSPMPTPEPQAMGIADLQDYLVAIAEAARSAVAADDYGAVRNSRRQLCEWADSLTRAYV